MLGERWEAQVAHRAASLPPPRSAHPAGARARGLALQRGAP
jgi:hypothetical protein